MIPLFVLAISFVNPTLVEHPTNCERIHQCISVSSSSSAPSHSPSGSASQASLPPVVAVKQNQSAPTSPIGSMSTPPVTPPVTLPPVTISSVTPTRTPLEVAASLIGQNIGYDSFWCQKFAARVLIDAGYPGPWADSPAWMALDVNKIDDPLPGDLVFIELLAPGLTPTGQISHVAVLDHVEGSEVVVIEGNGSQATASVVGWGRWPMSQVISYGRPR